MVNPNRFYTYAYLREDRTPYYIGKGKGNRAHIKGKCEVYPPKDKSRVIFLKQNLTEEEAFKHEIYMIAVLGRKDLGTGILRNKTNGGEGSSGIIISEETRDKMSKVKRRENNPNFGKTFSQEFRDKISGENNPKSINWRITFADGRIITQCGLANWAKENSYDTSNIYNVFQGKRKYHKDIVAVEKVA